MKRLTFEGNFCDIALCLERPGGDHCGDGACSQRKVWERLKYFEDREERSQWISVKERLPEPSTFVLALTAPGSLSLGRNCVVADYIHPRDEEYGVFAMAYDYREPLKVTHWMPLPEPPEGGTE